MNSHEKETTMRCMDCGSRKIGDDARGSAKYLSTYTQSALERGVTELRNLVEIQWRDDPAPRKGRRCVGRIQFAASIPTSTGYTENSMDGGVEDAVRKTTISVLVAALYRTADAKNKPKEEAPS